jgi:hypothetical protein
MVMSEATEAFDEDDQNLDPLQQMQSEEPPAGWVAPDKPHYKETTYFWHIEDGPDRDYARAYVAELYPHSQAMVVSELLIPRLNELNKVIIIARPNPRKFPVTREFRDPNSGYRMTEALPLMECLRGLRESPVIDVAKYITGSSRYSIGKFNANAFFDECSQYMFGGHMRIQEKEMVIRFIAG